MNITLFRDIAPCSPCVKQRFGGTYHLHLQGYAPATRCFLAQLIFDPEDGDDNLLLYVGSHTDYTAL
jgi:hypothetical protein